MRVKWSGASVAYLDDEDNADDADGPLLPTLLQSGGFSASNQPASDTTMVINVTEGTIEDDMNGGGGSGGRFGGNNESSAGLGSGGFGGGTISSQGTTATHSANDDGEDG